MPRYRFRGFTPQIPASTYVADTASVIGRVILGEETSVWPGAVIRADSEPITIGDGSLIGIQAIVLNHAVIGESSLVAAGSIVTERKTYPPRSLIMGAPAKVVRELTGDDLAMLRHAAETYIKRRGLYLTELVRLD